MSLTLQHGRPENMTERLKKEQKVYELLDLLHIECILGLMNDTDHRVRLLVDSDVLKEEYLGCHPCINTSSLRLKTKDIFNTFLNAVDHNMTEVHL